ncbi:MAG: GFA family protein [Halioglobus sp.]
MARISGSCICGDVTYSANGKLRDIIACHCTECRKSSGHYTASTSVRPEDLEIQPGSHLKWYRASSEAQRGFCQQCGCSLFWKPDSGDRISIFAGSVDGDVGLPLVAHIYLDEKGAYYDVGDDTENFATRGAHLSVEQ